MESDGFFGCVASANKVEYKRPLLRVVSGKPGWELTDEMGVAHYFTDGVTVKDAAFKGWDLSGFFLRNVRLDTVSFLSCDLKNAELQHSTFNRVLVDGGTGGLVVGSSSCRDVLVRNIRNTSSIFRFFNCDLQRVIVSHCQMGVGVAACKGNFVLNDSEFGYPTLFRHNHLSGGQIINCKFKNATFEKNLWTTFEISHVQFDQCKLDGTDWSLSTLTEVEFNKSRIRNMQVDGCTVSRVRLLEAWAQRINFNHTSVINLEVVGGEAVFSLTACMVETICFWNVRQGSLSCRDSYVLGLRICDSRFAIAGTCTTWWAPVLRRSRFFGDGTENIAIQGADISRCEIARSFGKFS